MLVLGGTLTLLLAACGGAAPATAPEPTVASTSGSAASAPSAAPSSIPSAVGSPSALPSPSAVAAPVPTAAAAQDNVNLSFTEISVSELPRLISKTEGFYTQNGLNVNDTQIPGVTGTAALIAGQVDVSISGGSEALAAAVGGADLAVVAVTVPKYDFVLTTTPSIQSPADLKGKKLGVPSIGSSSDIAARLMLEREGLDPNSDVTIVPLGNANQRLPALLGGAVDAVLLTPPDNVPATDAGFKTLVDVSALDIPGDVSGLVVRKSWLATHRDVMQRFIDAEVEAIAYAKKNPAQTQQIMRDNIQYPSDEMYDTAYNYFYQGNDPVIPSQPFPRPDQFNDSVSQLAQANPSVSSYDLSQLLDTSFVQSAVDRGLDK